MELGDVFNTDWPWTIDATETSHSQHLCTVQLLQLQQVNSLQTASTSTSVMYDDAKVRVGGFVLRSFWGHRDDRSLGGILVGGGGFLWRREEREKEKKGKLGVRKQGATGFQGYRFHQKHKEQLRMLAQKSKISPSCSCFYQGGGQVLTWQLLDERVMWVCPKTEQSLDTSR